MFGMVTALVVQSPAASAIEGASSPVVAAAWAARSTAYTCRIPVAG